MITTARGAWWWLAAALATAALAASCSGRAVVDADAGTGGGGGGSTSSSSSSSTSSSGSGCDCQTYCAIMVPCNYHGQAECPAMCQNANPGFRDCVCTVDSCSKIESCPNTASSSGGVGGGAGIPQGCQACIDQVDGSGACTSQAQQCQASAACQALVTCCDGCGWTQDCISKCAAASPDGLSAFSMLVYCEVCQSCWDPCQGAALAGNFCGQYD
ncbi:MAG: hypothetical protein HY744_14200 [Deltaproteobacteria bacterium]|nr:hypothetical protein [Deltaproteobacteria bacterium]